MSKTIDQIPKTDRPREKLRARGAAALKDHELLAILLGKGTARVNVMTLAQNLVQSVDAKGLNLKVEDLEHLEGMGAVKAMIVVAALEFARRRIKPGGLKITTPADILPLIRHFADRKQEHFLCITINGANEVINVRVVSIGLLDRTTVLDSDAAIQVRIESIFAGMLASPRTPPGPPKAQMLAIAQASVPV